MVEQADSILLRQAVRGDTDALMLLIDGLAPRLRRRVEHSIPARHRARLSAEDVLQEVYTEAYLGIGRFEPRGVRAFIGWLYALANNKLHDQLDVLDAAKRGGHRRPAVPLRGDDVPSTARDQDALSAVEARAIDELRAALRVAISRLPEANRRVIELHDQAGKPIAAVASALGRSQGAVSMLRTRALELLRQTLGVSDGSERRGATAGTARRTSPRRRRLARR